MPAPVSHDLADFFARVRSSGPAVTKLFQLRRQRPDIACELDEIARALHATTEQIEVFVREHWPGEGPDARPLHGE